MDGRKAGNVARDNPLIVVQGSGSFEGCWGVSANVWAYNWECRWPGDRK